MQQQLMGGQFVQSRQTVQKNQTQLTQQLNLPDSAKVQYQYSTKTVRTLSPGEVPARTTTTTATGARPATTTTQIVQPNTAARVQHGSAVSGSFAPTFTPQLKTVTSQPAQLAPRVAPAQPLISANKAVDLADSEHINITKSVYNATYNNPNQQSLGSNVTNTFSFGQSLGNDLNRGSLQSNQSFGNPTVNRSSGNYNTASYNSNPATVVDANANRVSGGTVYDYDQLRDY